VVGLLGLGLEVTVVLVGLLRLGVVTVVGILFVTLVGRLFIDPGGAWGSVWGMFIFKVTGLTPPKYFIYLLSRYFNLSLCFVLTIPP